MGVLIDAAVGDDGSAHALTAEARERLRVPALGESRLAQQLRCGDHALSPAPVQPDLERPGSTGRAVGCIGRPPGWALLS